MAGHTATTRRFLPSDDTHHRLGIPWFSCEAADSLTENIAPDRGDLREVEARVLVQTWEGNDAAVERDSLGMAY
jgi:hypothetical protein